MLERFYELSFSGPVRDGALLNSVAAELNFAELARLPPQVAVIDEAACIGCTKCIAACPFDAILGAPKQIHTVLTELCTGCELCVAPCPVDCIAMEGLHPAPRRRDWLEDALARYRAREHRLRLGRKEGVKRASQDHHPLSRDEMREEIAAAVQRARERRRLLRENRPEPKA